MEGEVKAPKESGVCAHNRFWIIQKYKMNLNTFILMITREFTTIVLVHKWSLVGHQRNILSILKRSRNYFTFLLRFILTSSLNVIPVVWRYQYFCMIIWDTSQYKGNFIPNIILYRFNIDRLFIWLLFIYTRDI